MQLVAERVRYDPKQALTADVELSRPQWAALDRWIATLKLRRGVPQPLLELKCSTHGEPGMVSSPADIESLTCTSQGLGRWDPTENLSPIWGWGEPVVADVGSLCVLLLPDKNGDLDRTVTSVVTCPPVL